MTVAKKQQRSSPEILLFKDAHEFDIWLGRNQESSSGIWLKLAKKDATVRSISYDEAIEVALCYGWIDGQKAARDTRYWLQRFTPRTSRSRWSQINRDKAEQLQAAGRMKARGLAEVERAKADGRWAAAYEGQRKATIPDDFQRALDRDRKAAMAFDELDASNRYSMIWRINDAKRPETREKRIAKYLDMLRRGERVHGS